MNLLQSKKYQKHYPIKLHQFDLFVSQLYNKLPIFLNRVISSNNLKVDLLLFQLWMEFDKPQTCLQGNQRASKGLKMFSW